MKHKERAIGISRQAQTVQVSCECRVAQAKACRCCYGLWRSFTILWALERCLWSSQALQLLGLLEDGTGEAKHSWLPWRVDACRPKQGGQVKAGDSQSTESVSQHYTMRVEAWTLQHEVDDGFRGVDAPGAGWIRDQAKTLELLLLWWWCIQAWGGQCDG